MIGHLSHAWNKGMVVEAEAVIAKEAGTPHQPVWEMFGHFLWFGQRLCFICFQI